MSQITSTKCYIDEYVNENDQVRLRLREKGTARTINLGMTATEAAKLHFLRFMHAADDNRGSRPDVFSKDSEEDCVLVSGNLDFDAPDEIRYIYNHNLCYRIH